MFITLQNKIQDIFNTDYEINFGEKSFLRVHKPWEHKKTFFIKIDEEGFFYNPKTGEEIPEEKILDDYDGPEEYKTTKIKAYVVVFDHVSGKEKLLYETREVKYTDEEVCENEFNNFVNYLIELLNEYKEDEEYLLYENEFITCERG